MTRPIDEIRIKVAEGVREATQGAPIASAPVAAAVVDKVTPIILHATNNEPWYQSRVTLGALLSILTGALGAAGVATDWIDPDQIIALVLAIGPVLGGMVSLYGRWKARKPIGS